MLRFFLSLFLMSALLAACNFEPAENTGAASVKRLSYPTTFSTDFPLGLPQDTRREITSADLHTRISTLADDAFEGRAPGTAIGETTADWIAAEFHRLGLSPAGENQTYFQSVDIASQSVDALSSSLIFTNLNTGGQLQADFGDRSVFWTRQQDALSVEFDTQPIVFVGYGIVAPEYGWNDYARADVTGKTVLILVNDPGFGGRDELFNGKAMTYYGRWTYKFEEAKRQGASGAILIHEDRAASYSWDVVHNSWSQAQTYLVEPPGETSELDFEGWITTRMAKRLFNQADMTLETAKELALETGFEALTLNGLTISGKIHQNIDRSTSRNVIGKIPGTQFPDEYILYSAHWDHLGKKASEKTGQRGQDFYRDDIFNGAVDNATGVAAILEIAEAMAQDPPKRSVLFTAFTLEEAGLLGSAYFAANPTVPPARIVAGINIDAMLPNGPSRDMVIIGDGASELEARLETALAKQGRIAVADPAPEAGRFYRSDHVSLAKIGVPVLYTDDGLDLIEGGISAGQAAAAAYATQRYHKPMDEYSKSWNVIGMRDDTRILYEFGNELAQSRDWPNWFEGTEFRAIRDASRQPGGK